MEANLVACQRDVPVPLEEHRSIVAALATLLHHRGGEDWLLPVFELLHSGPPGIRQSTFSGWAAIQAGLLDPLVRQISQTFAAPPRCRFGSSCSSESQ